MQALNARGVRVMGSGWHVGETFFYAMTVKWLQWATTASGCCAAIGVVCWANLMLLRAKFILWWIFCGSAYQGTKFQTILLFPWIWLLPEDWFPITNMIELSLCYEEWTSHFIRGYLTTGFYSLTPRLQAQDELFQLRAKCAAIEAQRPPRMGWSMVLCKWRSYSHTYPGFL